jgi:hypothetical protein
MVTARDLKKIEENIKNLIKWVFIFMHS